MAAAMLGNELVRRFCLNEQIFKANKLYRTHFHSHPDLASIVVDPLMLDNFYNVMARDAANGTSQCIKEWLTPCFVFFIEIHGTNLLPADQRMQLGRFFGAAVSQFNLVPTSILVLGWDGEVSNVVHGFRLRYIFEGVNVDRRHAFTIYSYIMHEAFKDSNEHLRKMLLGEIHVDSDWSRNIPSDPYLSPANGEKTLTMVGSIGMGACMMDSRIVGRNHSKCSKCLGSRRVPNTMPLSLFHVLDKDGQPAEDVAKIEMVDAIRRTALRTQQPLTESYMEPQGMPAVAIEVDKTNGIVLATHGVFKTEMSSQKSASSIEVTDPNMLKVFEDIIRRHDPHYAQLRVRKVFRCGTEKERYYRVHPHGFNDTYCLNICGHHGACAMQQENGWAGRIGFLVSEYGTRMVCFNRQPVSPLSGLKPCRNYQQRQDLHPLSNTELEVLKFRKQNGSGASGPTAHQMMFSILPELHAQVMGTAEPKKKKQRRGGR